MSAFLFFLLKVCVCILAFYLPYVLLLSKTTFFTANRIYLLVGLLLSFFLPTVIFETPATSYNAVMETFSEPFFQTQSIFVTNHSAPLSGNIDYVTVILMLYFIGVITHLVRLLLSVRTILKLKSKGEFFMLDGIRVVKIDTTEVFTFLNILFLPKAGAHPQIYQHEKTHIQQFHWIDLLILEITSILLWFNPLMIFYKRSIKLLHEYLADQFIIDAEENLEEYLQRMVYQFSPIKIKAPVSTFYFQSIKKRITMLTKTRTPFRALAIYLILIPIVSSILFAFSNKQVYTALNSNNGDTTFQNNLEFIPPLAIENLEISSGYGERVHPYYGKKMLHTGVDFVSVEGEKVLSAECGVVVISYNEKAGRGNFIVIKHDDTFSTSYSHLKTRMVKEGDKVEKAQVIGFVGNTGLSTNSHLHYEVLKNGEAVDPSIYITNKK